MIQQRLFGCPETVMHGLRLFEQDRHLIDNAEELISNWRTAYPMIDVDTEIRKAHSWQLSNPSKKKKNQARFINNWLNSATEIQNRSTAMSTALAIQNAMAANGA